MPPDLWDAVCALVGGQMVPGYASPSDLVRDAIVHRLKYWQDNPIVGQGDWTKEWVVSFAMTLTEKSAAMLKALRELPDAHRAVLEAAWSDGAYDIVEEGLNEMRGLVWRLPGHVAEDMLKVIDMYQERLVGVQRERMQRAMRKSGMGER